MVTSRTSTDGGRIIISGTGRAGTTLLVQYFTALGFDTGYDLDQAMTQVDPIANAGLERVALTGAPAYVLKTPFFANRLAGLVDGGAMTVKCCIVPMRELFAAAESRREVSRKAADAGLDETGRVQPGGLAFGARKAPQRQEQRLAVQFYTLVHTLVERDIPIHFLRFPDFARGEQNLFEALETLLVEHGVTRGESDAAFARVARPELISDFRAADQEPSGPGQE